MVHFFIGDEWDFVILSLVRSMPKYEIERKPSVGWCKKNMGFITDEHQINVALTRARLGLIIIGILHDHIEIFYVCLLSDVNEAISHEAETTTYNPVGLGQDPGGRSQDS